MKIDRIKIQVEDPKQATDIGLLVEQEEFLEEIGRLREKWKITELKKLFISPPVQELLNIDNIILKEITDRKEQEKMRDKFSSDIDKVLKRFNKGKNYKIVIEYALITGFIPEGIYQSCYFDTVTINEAEDLSKPEKYRYVIVLSSRAEQEDVLEAFREFREHIKNKILFESRSLPKLKESGNLITEQELKHFFEEHFVNYTAKYIKYKESIKEGMSLSEIVHEHIKFISNTESIRNQFEILRLRMPLSADRDSLDIETYHKGEVHELDDTAKYRQLTKFQRNREFFMISYKDVLDGKSDEPLKAGQVYKEWIKKCPKNGHIKPKDEGRVDCNCQYCTVFDNGTIQKGIDAYIEFLVKINKTKPQFLNL